ncbi:MAG: hypothetical protein PHF83_06655 [Candidatus Methanomethylophilus sp.]|nr:hypothetical protein [Methanomethylophilus sp.]
MNRIDKMGITLLLSTITVAGLALLLPRETVTVGAGLYIVSAVLIALALYGVALIFGKGVWFLAGVNTLTGTKKNNGILNL